MASSSPTESTFVSTPLSVCAALLIVTSLISVSILSQEKTGCQWHKHYMDYVWSHDFALFPEGRDKSVAFLSPLTWANWAIKYSACSALSFMGRVPVMIGGMASDLYRMVLHQPRYPPIEALGKSLLGNPLLTLMMAAIDVGVFMASVTTSVVGGVALAGVTLYLAGYYAVVGVGHVLYYPFGAVEQLAK